MSDPRLDPALGDLLDGYDVPPLSPDFADRVVAAATRPSPAVPVAGSSRRDRRGRWIRGHRVVIGVVAFGLMSAAAAATAIFGDVARTMPVIGPLIASVVPARAVPHVKKAVAAKPRPVPPVQADSVDTAPDIAPPVPFLAAPREIRREMVARRIAVRIERRAERRAELGLPPRLPRAARILPVLRRLPPGERAAVIERVREIRQERRAALLPPPELRLDPAKPAPDAGPALVPQVEAIPDAPVDSAVPEAARNPDRQEQLRRLRLFRQLQEHRRELRRERLQR